MAHTPDGTRLISNFVHKIAGLKPDWTRQNCAARPVSNKSDGAGDSDKPSGARAPNGDGSVAPGGCRVPRSRRRGCEGTSSTLRWGGPVPCHIFGDRGLTNFDAELEEPWIRGAPHSGLARLISRINWRISSGTFGLPPRFRDFHRQTERKPARCHRMTVSGFTMAEERLPGNQENGAKTRC